MRTYEENLDIYEEMVDDLVECLKCGEKMFMVLDPAIRDTCENCGGKSKIAYEYKFKEAS